MGARMSLSTRGELLGHIQNKYKKASWVDKKKILDEFITITGYDRKYAIHLLNSELVA